MNNKKIKPKKVPVAWRFPRHIIDAVQALADVEGRTDEGTAKYLIEEGLKLVKSRCANGGEK